MWWWWWRWAAAAAAGAGEAVVMLGEDEGGLRLLGLVVGGGCARADARRALVWFDWEGIGAPDTVVGGRGEGGGGRRRRGLGEPPLPSSLLLSSPSSTSDPKLLCFLPASFPTETFLLPLPSSSCLTCVSFSPSLLPSPFSMQFYS